MERFVLITGASTGIGRSATLAFSRAGYHVLAGVRTEKDYTNIRQENDHRLHPIMLDVTDQDQVEEAVKASEVIIGNGNLVAIINNAGLVVHGTVLHVPISEWRQQFEVNLFGLIRVTQQFFPLLNKPGPGSDAHPKRIINMGSVSGKFASPFLGPYSASKYALEAVSDSLRRELYYTDIQVVIIEAGKIATPIWDKARTQPSYAGPEHAGVLEFKDRLLDKMISEGLPQDSLNPLLLHIVKSGKVKARYLHAPDKFTFRLSTWLPAKWIDNAIHRKLRKQGGIRPF